jgi:type I restriction enzyme M protein
MASRTAISSKTAQTSTKRRDALIALLRHKYLFREEAFASRTLFLDSNDSSQPVPLCGFVFQTPNGAPFLLGVVALDSDKERATRDAFQYALTSETLGLVAVSLPEQETPKFFRRHFNQPKFDEIPELEYYCKGALGPQGVLLEDSRPYRTKAKELAQQPLLPISNKLENIFFELHSCMRDIDGLHADAALEELCKLLYVKIYDEELLEREDHETLHTKEFGCCEEYAASIRRLYREAIEYDLRVFRLKIPQYERSRGVFNQPSRIALLADVTGQLKTSQ